MSLLFPCFCRELLVEAARYTFVGAESYQWRLPTGCACKLNVGFALGTCC